MARLMDDEVLAQTVTAGFLADMPLQIGALRGFIETGDASGAVRQVHTIKGASANVGGRALSGVAAEMERTGETGDLNALKTRLVDLEYELDRCGRRWRRKNNPMEKRTPHATAHNGPRNCFGSCAVFNINP